MEYGNRGRDVHASNLAHAIANDCTDPDCEIHHPEVGQEEGTINETDLAFYFAGYFAGISLAIEAMQDPDLHALGYDELMNRGLMPKPEQTDE